MSDNFLLQKLNERKRENAYRQLRLPEDKIDFCSNDYLGIVTNRLIEGKLIKAEASSPVPVALKSGSTGSRLLTGNYPLIEETEKEIARFHQAEAGLIYNSGFDSNVGLLSCVPRRGDTIIYDYLSHASLRDGIRLSLANSFPFIHNDPEDLKLKLQTASGNIFVVTESVFSMDGDKAPLQQLAELCDQYSAHLIVDEAHATGVVGNSGAGLVQQLGLQHRCFARIHTFGKACGAHGAIILGTGLLRNYLINFSKTFIYSTALPEASIAAIKASYQIFPYLISERIHLINLISQFQNAGLKYRFLKGDTPIQIVIIPGNDKVKNVADKLRGSDLDVRPILYPSVPKGSERLRIVLHSFNTVQQVNRLISLLQ